MPLLPPGLGSSVLGARSCSDSSASQSSSRRRVRPRQLASALGRAPGLPSVPISPQLRAKMSASQAALVAAGWAAEDARHVTDPVRYLTRGGDRVDEVVYFTIVDDLIADARAGKDAEGGGAAPSDVQG